MKSFNITIGLYSGIVRSDMINGLVGRLLMQDIHPDGFEEITLSQFHDDVGNFDQ